MLAGTQGGGGVRDGVEQRQRTGRVAHPAKHDRPQQAHALVARVHGLGALGDRIDACLGILGFHASFSGCGMRSTIWLIGGRHSPFSIDAPHSTYGITRVRQRRQAAGTQPTPACAV